jgi:dCMP deaminase
MTDTRPGWDSYFRGIAEAVAKRADCTRRQIGAVIVRDNRIVSTGYNGAPPGAPGCRSAGACPRGRHYVLSSTNRPRNPTLVVLECACGGPWPCPEAVQKGSSYDTGPGSCIALHAEQNAIMYAGRDGCQGSTMYITDKPCDGCERMIEASGLVRVCTPSLWWDL